MAAALTIAVTHKTATLIRDKTVSSAAREILSLNVTVGCRTAEL